MKLAVLSHKVCWHVGDKFATDGGFVYQIETIADLFDHTLVLVPIAKQTPVGATTPFTHSRVSIQPLLLPKGRGPIRKLLLIVWLARHVPRLIGSLRQVDAVHTPIPGDIGTLGMVLAKLMGKRLFVRYCGNWANRRTFAERLWHRWLPRLRLPRNVVLATGGGTGPPEPRWPHIRWIFATTMKTADQKLLAERARQRLYQANAPRLIIASRMEPQKGIEELIEAWTVIQNHFAGATLEIVGDGSLLQQIQDEVAQASLSGIRFHGKVPRDRVLEIMMGCHLFVFPTLSEGFPKVVHEALTCGLPVITTQVSVLRTLVDGRNGYSLDGISSSEIVAGVTSCYESEEIYRDKSNGALETAAKYNLELWREFIGTCLSNAWGPLRHGH